MLNRPRELALPRPTAALTAASSAYVFKTHEFLVAQEEAVPEGGFRDGTTWLEERAARLEQTRAAFQSELACFPCQFTRDSPVFLVDLQGIHLLPLSINKGCTCFPCQFTRDSPVLLVD